MQSVPVAIRQFKAKLPEDVHDWLQAHAARNCSTITAELVRAIRATKEREESAGQR